MILDDILDRINGMTEDQQAAIVDLASQTINEKFIPNPGPQTEAYNCEADELFYGGKAGGGKTALITGLAYQDHTNSMVLRRINKDALEICYEELIGTILDGDDTGWQDQKQTYRKDGKKIEFRGCEHEKDKQRFKGRPNDLIAFDEVTDFSLSQYVFISIWNRTTVEGQRCRIIATGNPPTNANGLWVIQRWAPWLDPTHPNPAKPGELRWFISDEEGKDTEVDGQGPHKVGDKDVYARSRTFIPAELRDNPDLAADGEYERMLDALPKELRDAYRDGNFNASLKDEPNQMIPTAWLKAAMDRWTPHPPEGVPMCAISLDAACGGVDNNIITMRYDGYFPEQVVIPGKETPVGTDCAGLVMSRMRNNAEVVIDCGGGYGNSAYKHFSDNNMPVTAYKGSEGTLERSENGVLGFNNVRSAAHWKLREALDPDQLGGSPITLPNDPELLSDLTAVKYDEKSGKIAAEAKEKLKKDLGRSPDKGDGVVMAWWRGNKQANIQGGWQNYRNQQQPKVIMGRGNHGVNRARYKR